MPENCKRDLFSLKSFCWEHYWYWCQKKGEWFLCRWKSFTFGYIENQKKALGFFGSTINIILHIISVFSWSHNNIPNTTVTVVSLCPYLVSNHLIHLASIFNTSSRLELLKVSIKFLILRTVKVQFKLTWHILGRFNNNQASSEILSSYYWHPAVLSWVLFLSGRPRCCTPAMTAKCWALPNPMKLILNTNILALHSFPPMIVCVCAHTYVCILVWDRPDSTPILELSPCYIFVVLK